MAQCRDSWDTFLLLPSGTRDSDTVSMLNRVETTWRKWNKRPWMGYVLSLTLVALATLLRMSLEPILGSHAPFTVYYVAVMFAAWYGGWGPALLAMASGGFLAVYLFIEPHGSILIHDLEQQVGVVLYFVVDVVVITLTESLRRSRRSTEAARARLADSNRALEKEMAERGQAEQWLLESEQRFRGYFEQGLVGMAMLSEQKEWIEVNHRLCRLLGCSEEELTRKAWTELTYPDDLPLEDVQIHRMLDGVIKGFVMDKRFVRKDGTILYTSLWVQCMRKNDGTLDCILVLAQDITDRKRTEADLRSAKDSAERLRQPRNRQTVPRTIFWRS